MYLGYAWHHLEQQRRRREEEERQWASKQSEQRKMNEHGLWFGTNPCTNCSSKASFPCGLCTKPGRIRGRIS